ncbi:MAG: ATP-binding cassette domain-containing protein [Thiovulaceae bacterium]|nr:ATP-binding cassette domain-containing protein [Sulfurimonadaceae bacterium]
MEVLSLKDISFSFTKGIPLLKKFSMTIKKGEVVTVVGPSGSGKSTLLEIIIGNIKAQNGTVFKAKVSQVFQDPYSSFHKSYTIRNQIEDVASSDKIDEYMKVLQLDDTLLGKKAYELSGGQLQRFSILRALLMEPDLLLLDEPTSALDNVTQLEVMKMLMNFLDDFGILLITHDDHLAKWCSDRIHHLKGPKL